MKQKSLCLISLILLLIFFILNDLSGCKPTSSITQGSTRTATDGKNLYFPETGHTIQAPFLAYYIAHDGLTRLGYPITEAIAHEGWQVQYFQNARLEVHPENQPAYFITVGWLGQLSHRTQPPIYHHYKIPGRYFPETGHTLNGDFLTYFEINGGTVQFGQPISEPFIKQGRISQDFQSARFIWHPNWPSYARVTLEPLGENYFLASGLPLELLAPVSIPSTAEIHTQPSISLPENTDITLHIERTPQPTIIRVVVTLLHHGLPLTGYAPRLTWLGNSRRLPPTSVSGQTHSLIDISEFQHIVFTLYTTSGKKKLGLLSYENNIRRSLN